MLQMVISPRKSCRISRRHLLVRTPDVGLQRDGEFEKEWPAVLGTLLDETESRYRGATLVDYSLSKKR